MKKKRALGNLDYQGPFGNTLLHGAVRAARAASVTFVK